MMGKDFTQDEQDCSQNFETQESDHEPKEDKIELLGCDTRNSSEDKAQKQEKKDQEFCRARMNQSGRKAVDIFKKKKSKII